MATGNGVDKDSKQKKKEKKKDKVGGIWRRATASAGRTQSRTKQNRIVY